MRPPASTGAANDSVPSIESKDDNLSGSYIRSKYERARPVEQRKDRAIYINEIENEKVPTRKNCKIIMKIKRKREIAKDTYKRHKKNDE